MARGSHRSSVAARLLDEAILFVRWLAARESLPETGEALTPTTPGPAASRVRWLLAPETLPTPSSSPKPTDRREALRWLTSDVALPPEPVEAAPSTGSLRAGPLRWLISRDRLPELAPLPTRRRRFLAWVLSGEDLVAPNHERQHDQITED